MTSRRLFRPIAATALLLALAACPATIQKTTVPGTSATSSQPALMAESLMGMDPAGLTGLFGAPDFRRIDAPAELWQYRSDACLLDIFLYRDATSPDKITVTHIAARGHGNAKISGDACVMATRNGPRSIPATN